MTDHAFFENSEKLDTFHFNDTTQTVTGKNKKNRTNHSLVVLVLLQHIHLDGFVICGALKWLRVDGDRYCEALPSAGPTNKPARAKLFSRFP